MKRILSMMLILMLIVSMICTSAFAASTPEETAYLESIGYNGWVKSFLQDTANSNSTIAIGGTTYYIQDGKTLADFETRLSNAYKSSQVTSKIGDITGDTGLGVEANIGAGQDTLSGFVPILNVLLGIIVVLITLALAVFTSFDVCYIVFPVFRNKCEDAKVSGQGPMVGHTANGGTKLRWVSDEAQFAVASCATGGEKSPLSMYFGKRVVTYIAVTVILFILLTGNINVITNIALRIVSGIMDVLGTLG